MKRCLFSVMVLLGLCAAGAAAGFGIRGSVVANGGPSAPPASNDAYRLYGTAGQAGVGIGGTGNARACSGFWCFGGTRVLDAPGGVRLPREFALGPTTPNPAHGRARFALALPAAARVTLTVYDVAGRQIGEAVSRRLEAGEHELVWEAPGARAGIYFMSLVADGVLKAKRTIVLVR